MGAAVHVLPSSALTSEFWPGCVSASGWESTLNIRPSFKRTNGPMPIVGHLLDAVGQPKLVVDHPPRAGLGLGRNQRRQKTRTPRRGRPRPLIVASRFISKKKNIYREDTKNAKEYWRSDCVNVASQCDQVSSLRLRGASFYFPIGVTSTRRKWISPPSDCRAILPGKTSQSVAWLSFSPLTTSVIVVAVSGDFVGVPLAGLLLVALDLANAGHIATVVVFFADGSRRLAVDLEPLKRPNIAGVFMLELRLGRTWAKTWAGR